MPTPGFVYVLGAGGGVFKIGKAQRLTRRMNQLSIQLPQRAEIVALLYSSDMGWLESGLHRVYADQRMNGEWFQLSMADIEDLAQVSVVTAVFARFTPFWEQVEQAISEGFLSAYAMQPFLAVKKASEETVGQAVV